MAGGGSAAEHLRQALRLMENNIGPSVKVRCVMSSSVAAWFSTILTLDMDFSLPSS